MIVIIQRETAIVTTINRVDSELLISLNANHHPLDTNSIGETKQG
jgi:hypothetical protein